LLEAAKSIFKLAVAGTAVWSVLKAAVPLLPAALFWEPATLVERTGRQVLHILVTLLAAQGVLAGADIVRARLKHASGLRMTRQEIRDEHKETEGDPHIKARIRRLRMQRARRRMLAAVPKAVVVLTNPTHYAVALAYERGSTGAPRVVAKGVDAMAERIRAIAREHRVPLVANPPLARALYPSQLDAEIPRELFQAVAEVIAYVWRLSARAR
jgi:flagellar biosynthetic protein FlhB